MTEKRFTCEVTDTDLCHIETITDNFEMNTFDDVETVTELLNKFSEENKELKEINQDNQDYISSLEEEKNNLQIKLQKIRDYAIEDGEVKQGVIEKVIMDD